MRNWKLISAVLAGTLALAACTSDVGTSADPTTSTAPESMAPESMAPESMAPESMAPEESMDIGGEASITTDAANLRVDLNYLLGEHLNIGLRVEPGVGRSDLLTPARRTVPIHMRRPLAPSQGVGAFGFTPHVKWDAPEGVRRA